MFKCRECSLLIYVENWWWVDQAFDVVGVKNTCGCRYTATIFGEDLVKLKGSARALDAIRGSAAKPVSPLSKG